MKKLCMLCICLLLAGCSCSTTQPAPTPTPLASPSPTPSTSPQTSMNMTKDYLDYLSKNYTLNQQTQLNQLDKNVQDGYSFSMDDQDYYLLRFDSSNSSASNWLSDALKNGYLEVNINDQMQKYNALVNQDFILLYSADQIDSEFKDYFQKYDYHSPSDPNTN